MGHCEARGAGSDLAYYEHCWRIEEELLTSHYSILVVVPEMTVAAMEMIVAAQEMTADETFLAAVQDMILGVL